MQLIVGQDVKYQVLIVGYVYWYYVVVIISYYYFEFLINLMIVDWIRWQW